WLDSIQGRRKTLLLFTEGWPAGALSGRRVDGRPEREHEGTEGLQGGRRGILPGGTLFDPADHPHPSGVHLHSYGVRGLVVPISTLVSNPHMLSADPAQAAQQVGALYSAENASNSALRSIADQTGGLAFVESNDYRRGFERIVEDNSHYYVLGYDSPNPKR